MDYPMVIEESTGVIIPVVQVSVAEIISEYHLWLSRSDVYGPNLWDDTLATGETGWVYEGDGVWAATSASSGFSMLSLVTAGDTAKVTFEVLERTAGNIKARVLGTVSGVAYTEPGIYSSLITDNSGYTKCGMVGFSLFTGRVRIISFKKKK